VVLSGNGCASQIVDGRPVHFEPSGVPLAQLALPERPALAIGVSGKHGGASAAAADSARRRIPARKQLNLVGQVQRSFGRLNVPGFFAFTGARPMNYS
jgi:hypothetical protein